MARALLQDAIEDHSEQPPSGSHSAVNCTTRIAPCELSALRVLAATAMPAVYNSVEHVRESHHDVLGRLRELLASDSVHFSQVPSIHSHETREDPCFTSAHLALTCDVSPLLFRLSYLGLTERPHLEMMSSIFRKGMPSLVFTADGAVHLLNKPPR